MSVRKKEGVSSAEQPVKAAGRALALRRGRAKGDRGLRGGGRDGLDGVPARAAQRLARDRGRGRGGLARLRNFEMKRTTNYFSAGFETYSSVENETSSIFYQHQLVSRFVGIVKRTASSLPNAC